MNELSVGQFMSGFLGAAFAMLFAAMFAFAGAVFERWRNRHDDKPGRPDEGRPSK